MRSQLRWQVQDTASKFLAAQFMEASEACCVQAAEANLRALQVRSQQQAAPAAL